MANHPPPRDPAPAKGPRTAILAVFFLQAFAAGGLFPRIPDIQAGLALDETTLGLALTTAALGGLLANLYAGRAAQALGTRAMLAAGIPLVAALTAAVALAPSMGLLFVVLLLMGIVFSLTNVAMNVEADRVEAATERRIMNRCHGAWSAGMLLAAATGVGARAVPVSAGLHLAALVPVAGVLSVVILARMAPSPPAPGDRAGRSRLALPSRRSILLMLFGLSGGVSQVGTQNFSVIFMRDTFDAPAWVDTLSLPAFLVTMMLGRMVADGWTERAGPGRVSFSLSLVAMIGATLVAAAPEPVTAILGFALMGVGVSVLFPLMVSAAARSGARPPAESVSAVILATGVVMLWVPAAQGWLAETLGLRATFAAMIPPMLLTLALVRVAVPERTG